MLESKAGTINTGDTIENRESSFEFVLIRYRL